MSRIPLLVVPLLALPSAALAQKKDDDAGIGPAPKEARAVVARAVRAMGGKRALLAVVNAAMTVKVKKGQIQERHTLKVDGRVMHYRSRRASGAGFDVVVGGGQAFLCDRSKQGRATFVQDLKGRDAVEGAYERDVLFMPVLLAFLLKDKARMDYRGKNSKGDLVVRARITPTKRAKQERRFTIRLLFDKKTHMLTSAMGVVPWGHDKGKKRYCTYSDYKVVKRTKLKRRILLPHTLSDQRGRKEKARVFQVRWELNATLSTSLFVRPSLKKKKASSKSK